MLSSLSSTLCKSVHGVVRRPVSCHWCCRRAHCVASSSSPLVPSTWHRHHRCHCHCVWWHGHSSCRCCTCRIATVGIACVVSCRRRLWWRHDQVRGWYKVPTNPRRRYGFSAGIPGMYPYLCHCLVHHND